MHKATQKDSIMIERVFKKILDCSFKVHSELGPGLLESSYQECLYYELNNAGLKVSKQHSMPLVYKDVKLDVGYRIDLLVENMIVVEIKSIDSFSEVHFAQILTYMRLSGCKLGLLVNFNVQYLKQGIKRMNL
jgi:GxxExxY protein